MHRLANNLDVHAAEASHQKRRAVLGLLLSSAVSLASTQPALAFGSGFPGYDVSSCILYLSMGYVMHTYVSYA